MEHQPLGEKSPFFGDKHGMQRGLSSHVNRWTQACRKEEGLGKTSLESRQEQIHLAADEWVLTNHPPHSTIWSHLPGRRHVTHFSGFV